MSFGVALQTMSYARKQNYRRIATRVIPSMLMFNRLLYSRHAKRQSKHWCGTAGTRSCSSDNRSCVCCAVFLLNTNHSLRFDVLRECVVLCTHLTLFLYAAWIKRRSRSEQGGGQQTTTNYPPLGPYENFFPLRPELSSSAPFMKSQSFNSYAELMILAIKNWQVA